MTIPDFQMMMLPLLRMFNEGQTQVSDCLPGLIAHFNLSKDEAAELLPSGQMTYLNNRANWARSYMGKAGLLASPKRGVHEITDLGRKFLATQPTAWIQVSSATFDLKAASSSAMASSGVFHPRVLRGRWFIRRATSFSSV